MHNTRAPRIVKLIELRYCFELTIFSVYNRIVAAADVVSNLNKISDSFFALLELNYVTSAKIKPFKLQVLDTLNSSFYHQQQVHNLFQTNEITFVTISLQPSLDSFNTTSSTLSTL